jgi:hypothetical protein
MLAQKATPERSRCRRAQSLRRIRGEAVAERAKALCKKKAAGNAVVLQRLLMQERVSCSLQTTLRLLIPCTRALWRAQAATVQFETAPGKQMQGPGGMSLGCTPVRHWHTRPSKRRKVLPRLFF